MRTIHYKTPMSRKDWERYAQLRIQYKNGEISHARYVFLKGIVLESGSLTNLAYTYDPYFAAIMGKEEGEKSCTDERIADILAGAKCVHDKIKTARQYDTTYERFRGVPVQWEYFRPHDESFCDYDRYTQKVVLPWKLSKNDEYDFREQFHIEYHDPYCDGRDCTGAPFTGWMRFLRCKDRTIILHCVEYDV